MAGGQGRSGNGRRQQKQLNSEMPCVTLKTSRRLEPILLRSSASGKTNTFGVHVHVAQFNLGSPSAGNPPFLKFVLL